MKKFKSGISYGLLASVIVVLGVPLFFIELHLSIILINTLIWFFILHLFFNTYYIIDGEVLIIKCGLVVNKELPINTITAILESSSILSAPAASFDRLKIKFDNNNFILISPKEKHTFIKDILQINPSIAVKLKQTT